jgi:outer membrane phospholipase A
MRDPAEIEELQNRLAERYTSSELVEILDITEWEIILEFWERVFDNPDVLKYLGYTIEDD